jgi:hypothetical protein
MGRKKGAKNKFTNLKESFLNAYQAKDGFGGDEALKKFAKNNPAEFLNMVKMMLPKNLDLSSDGPITLRVIYDKPRQLADGP